MTYVLNDDQEYVTFAQTPGTLLVIGTSGNLNGAAVKLQYYVAAGDAYVDYPDSETDADVHMAKEVRVVSSNSRIILVGGTSPQVNVIISEAK